MASARNKHKKNTIFRQNCLNIRKIKSGSTAGRIRDETTLARLGLKGLFSKIDFNTDITLLLTQLIDPSPDFQHIVCPLQKLMVCNTCLHTMQDSTHVSVPFVFRLPLSMQNLPARDITSRIQKQLKKTLGNNLHYWLTFEYTNRLGNANRHINGEILLDTSKLRLFAEALNSFYKTPEELKAKYYATRVLKENRDLQAKLHGIQYAVLNWPSYALKERSRIILEQRLTKRRAPDRIVYISRPLSQTAKTFYAEQVSNKKPLRKK